MGIRLIVEVLKHAPEELTWRERYALVVLAENANDRTRECWPGIEDDPDIARKMKIPGRSSRYDVLKALRSKGALEGVSAGHRGRRAVYRIPVMGPGSTDAIDPTKGPESTDKGSGVHGPNQDEKGSGNAGQRVRDPRTKGPESTDPFPSHPSEAPQEETSTAGRPITAEEKLEFGRFWHNHPKSKDYDKTLEAWSEEVRAGVDPVAISVAALAYAREMAGQEFRFVKHSANWLREHRYEDKFAPEPNGKPNLRSVDGKAHKPYEPPSDHSVYANGF